MPWGLPSNSPRLSAANCKQWGRWFLQFAIHTLHPLARFSSLVARHALSELDIDDVIGQTQESLLRQILRRSFALRMNGSQETKDSE